MKKFFTLFVVLFVFMFGFSSLQARSKTSCYCCRGPAGPEGPVGPKGDSFYSAGISLQVVGGDGQGLKTSDSIIWNGEVLTYGKIDEQPELSFDQTTVTIHKTGVYLVNFGAQGVSILSDYTPLSLIKNNSNGLSEIISLDFPHIFTSDEKFYLFLPLSTSVIAHFTAGDQLKISNTGDTPLQDIYIGSDSGKTYAFFNISLLNVL